MQPESRARRSPRMIRSAHGSLFTVSTLKSSFWLQFLILPAALAAAVVAGSSPGNVDPGFNAGRGPTRLSPGSGSSVLLQGDGKILVGGYFNSVNLTYVPPIIRFNADGSLDPSFDASVLSPPRFDPSGSSDMSPLALQTNGQILVGGRFVNSDGSSRYFVRLNPDGSLDRTFVPRIEKSSRAWTINQASVLGDGKIVIAGGFDRVNGVARNGLARLNADGSLDPTFNSSVAGAFRVQASGKLIVAAQASIYRINSDGSLDDSFRAEVITPDGGSGYIGSFLVQPDDKVLFSYRYGYFDNTVMRRLNADGANDGSFQPFNSYGGELLLVQADGKVLMTSLNGSEPGRLNSDGTPDWTFKRDRLGYSVAQQSDGRLVTAGPLYDVPYGIRRLLLDGSLDPSFAPDLGLTVITQAMIWRTILLPNGKIIIAGDFDHIDRAPRKRVALLSADGTPDRAFEEEDVLDGVLAVQADGKLLAAADNKVVRINQDGTQDPTFNYSIPNACNGIQAVVQPDAKILVVCSDLPVRLHRDGTEDATFYAEERGRIVFLQADGKIVLTDYQRGLKRLDANGSRDSGFTAAGLNMFNPPYAIALQPDGKFLISRPGVATFGDVFVRLNGDGSADDSFNPDVSSVRLIAVDQAGIYAAREIVPGGAAKRFGICRLNFDGTRDPDFNVEFNPGATLSDLITLPDGQLLVIGKFDRVNGIERHGIARVIGSAPKKVANISTRVRVGTDDSVAIGGFIITGSAPKKVIIRALGPSLEVNHGLTDTLANPTLEIHDSRGGIVGGNDDWRDTREVEIVGSGLPPASNVEAAVVMTLHPGAYTAVIRGKEGGTGVALAEIYDLDPGADSALGNISTRGLVEREDKVMIGGFILRGPAPSTVAVRAVGPSLASAGVRDALADPALTLHDQSGAVVASNNDWKQTQQSELETYGMGLTNDREAAVVSTLPPGGYTAIVRSAGGQTGVGLVEVYKLD